MALNKGNLGLTTQIGVGSSHAVVVVGSGKTVYMKSMLICNNDSASRSVVYIHAVPNNSGALGLGNSTTVIARLGISTADTYFFAPAYPVTLTSTNASIYVENTGPSQGINVIALGDTEI